MKKVWKAGIAGLAALSIGAAGFIGTTAAFAVEGDGAGQEQPAAPTQGKITADDHSYDIYQIFTGDYSRGTLSNVKAGKNYTGANTEAGIKAALEALTAVNTSDATNQQKLKVIEKYVDLNGDAFASVAAKGNVEVPFGYYIMVDTQEFTAGDKDSKGIYVAKVVGDVTITGKRDTISSEKHIKDTTNGVEGGWQQSADHMIGDDISYQLVANLPDNVDQYRAGYELKFIDDMSKGLTYKAGSAIVYKNGTKVAEVEPTSPATKHDGTTITSQYNEGKVWMWALGDITQAPYAATNKDVITIEYKATLNKDAVIGSEGNPNGSYVEFSSNPNLEEGGEYNTTPEQTAIDFTYKFEVNKKDDKNQDLTGAMFTLHKVEGDKEIKIGETKGLFNNADPKFTFSGLDDGTYILRETQTPAGFNTIKPIKFTIAAGHVVNTGTSDAFADPTFTKNDGTGFFEGKIEFTVPKNAGSASVDVVNNPGSNLPETGGMGTTMLYVAGGAIVLIAGIGMAVALRRRQA